MTVQKGLEGIIATKSSISTIIDDQLTYVGYNINDLVAQASFEEVIYLLWYLKLPTKEALANFKVELTENSDLPPEVIDHLRSYDLATVHPMAALRTAVSFLGLFDEEADVMNLAANRRKAIRLQAQMATLVAAFARLRQGKEPISPNKQLSYAANFLYMLTGTEADDIAVEAMDQSFILHADHELNASTFTARVCVATLSDVYSGITAALGALKGPLHGGANESVMKMLLEIGSEDNIIPYLDAKFANKEVIMGMGHRVYQAADPRAKHLQKMSKKVTALTGQSKWYEMSTQIEAYVKEQKNLPTNVDFYSASLYHSLGIEHDLFTPIFAVSRVSGWLAHILEQYKHNRLIRPRAKYTGPGLQTFIPLQERS